VEQGYDVTGVYLECWRAPGCRTDEDRQDALKVALELGIPFKVLDFKDTYKNKVVEYFFDEYEAGRTPNPDVLCNKEIKFGLFYDWAMAEGFDFVATGHYAAIEKLNGKNCMVIPKDTHKDQTYFLYRMRPDQLEEVRQEAMNRDLAVATKKDSVGICFIGDINVHDFLKERLGENPGDVVDVDGNVIGRHTGLWFYTIGQRHGFTINATTSIKQSDGTEVDRTNIPPFYVIDKNPAKNQLVVGFGAQTLQPSCQALDWHWSVELNEQDINDTTEIDGDWELVARIRHTGTLIPAQLQFSNTNTATVTFIEPARGVAAGQSVVMYGKKINTKVNNIDGDESNEWFCLGGGVIDLPGSYK
jgi:tRNA-specific 2-thiouridylase